MDQVDRLRTALADRYELDRQIGSGGMAHVYLAHDRQHDRAVAVKVLRPELAAAIGTERFLREIRIEARLQHPHILPLYDSGTADGLLYYVMPFVEGETLRQRIQRERQLPLTDALQITNDVADALSYAHAHQVVHRDIKPANILLTGVRSGDSATGGTHALVADFGIAKAISDADEEVLTSTGIAVGTPEYMSPEQGSGDGQVDARTDVYALGCVLYEMLTGEPPFMGRSAQVVMARHRLDPPASLRTVRPSVNPELDEVVKTALAKVPADRYPSITHFVQALAVATSPELRSSAHRRASAVGSSRPALRWAVALAVLGLAALAAWWRLVPSWSRTVDPNKVMVFPVIDHRAGNQDNRAGEEIAILIGSALERTEPLKWIDGWTLLDERRRDDARLLTSPAARALSLAKAAGFYLDGAIAGLGDSVTVTLRLHDTRADSVVGQTSVSGAALPTALPELGLRAAAALLPSLLQPGTALDLKALAALADRRPAAVASWLQGEREYRRSRFSPALEYFTRALQADSALAVAALRGAEAADWLGRPAQADSLVTIAVAHVGLLPTRYVELARGMKQAALGEADSAVAHYRRALAVDSTWSEGWMLLGETYYHLIPRGWALDSVAEAAFRRSRELDRSFTPPLLHLAEMASREGHLGEAQTFVDLLRRGDSDSTMSRPRQLMIDCARPGPSRVNWDAAVRADPAAVLEAGHILVAGARSPDCAMHAFRSVLAADTPPRLKWGALLGVHHLLVAQHRFEAARRVVDSAVATLPPAMGLYVLDAVSGAGAADQAAGVIASLAGPYDSMSTDRLWYHGIWQAHRGDTASLAAVTRALARNASRSGSRRDSVVTGMMAARLDLLRNDTAKAIVTLQSLAPVGTSSDIAWGLWESLAAERLQLGRLLLARGFDEEALRVAGSFDREAPLVNVMFLPASLALRAQAAKRLGRQGEASRFMARLAALERAP